MNTQNESSVVKESLTAQSKTPRTDAAHKWFFGDNRSGMEIECVQSDFARQLETELAEAIKEREMWLRQHEIIRRERDNSFDMLSKTLGNIGCTPSQPEVDLEIDSSIQCLKHERDQLRAQVERMEREFGEISIQCERVTVCLSSMVTIAKNDDWHLATTGRQIVVRESEEALASTEPGTREVVV